MKKLRPKDILLNDPYFEQTMYCGTAELRKAKRIDIFGKWHKTHVLAASLLKDGSLTFTHDIDAQHGQGQRRLTFRMYEQTASRLFINTYFWTSQLQKEIYVGTIHIKAYEYMQQLRDFQYKGIIDLVIIKQDDDIVDIAPEFKLIQEIKHEFALSLGMYLLAVSESSWLEPAASKEMIAHTPSVLLGKEREELQQLRKEKAIMEACSEELLRLRIEAKKLKAVESELQRLRHELNTELSERTKDKDAFERALQEKDNYIENIKEKTAKQLNDMMALSDELNTLKATIHATAASQTTPQQQTPSHSMPKQEDQELSIPTFMSQHDYTRDLDNVLNCQRVSYIGGSIEWQQYVASRFPQLVMLIRQRDPMLAVEESHFIIINVYEGETEEIKRIIAMAKEVHCPMITTSAYNLNNMAKDILKAVQQL